MTGTRLASTQQRFAASLKASTVGDALMVRAILAEVLQESADATDIDGQIAALGLHSPKPAGVQKLAKLRMGWGLSDEALHGEMTR